MTYPNLDKTLEELREHVKTQLAVNPEVVATDATLSVDDLFIEARKWHLLENVVAVVADMQGSTNLGFGKHLASTATIYEASTGGLVRSLKTFDPNYIAIQGDGAVALFWGELAMERALCAGITVKTFSERHLVPQLAGKWENLPTTGLKVGIASSRVLVKKVGIPRTSHQEPVWAGKAVNFAAKCAQQAVAGELIVTGSVWDFVEENDYLSLSCECGTGPAQLWSDVTIKKIAGDEGEDAGRLLRSAWCMIHGAEFCASVLEGKSERLDAPQVREAMVKALRHESFMEAQRVKRIATRNRIRGLAMRHG
jgi:class 3 adenylate cyclase